MAYFKDLTPYKYFQNSDKQNIPILNVGWLETDEFEKGETSQEFREKLFQFCLDQNLVLIARGFQECVFCGLSWVDWGRKHPDYGLNAELDEHWGWRNSSNWKVRSVCRSCAYLPLCS